jgi:transcriptional regulator with XRE-family HTH domain
VQPKQQFAANLRRLRLAAGLSQMELGDRAGLHFSEVSRLERGLRDPRLTTIVRLAGALQVPPADLLPSG